MNAAEKRPSPAAKTDRAELLFFCRAVAVSGGGYTSPIVPDAHIATGYEKRTLSPAQLATEMENHRGARRNGRRSWREHPTSGSCPIVS